MTGILREGERRDRKTKEELEEKEGRVEEPASTKSADQLMKSDKKEQQCLYSQIFPVDMEAIRLV